MYEDVRGRAKRVLVVGASASNDDISPDTALAADGKVIFMEEDAVRAAEIRRIFAKSLGDRATVIAGDPRRMLYKLSGPFDVIFCGAAYQSARPLLEKLLAPNGVLITNGER